MSLLAKFGFLHFACISIDELPRKEIYPLMQLLSHLISNQLEEWLIWSLISKPLKKHTFPKSPSLDILKQLHPTRR
jgi:hypothetical protein